MWRPQLAMPWTEALSEGREQAEQWKREVHKRLPVTLPLICPFSGLSNPAPRMVLLFEKRYRVCPSFHREFLLTR